MTNCEQLVGLFRKPDGGMLTHLKNCFSTTWTENKFLMTGDRPEDLGAAQAAGFDFMWAEDWRNNELDKVLPYRSEEWIPQNS